MHPNESNAVLTAKLSDRLRPHAIKDEHLRIALGALAQIDDAPAYLETDVQDRISNFVAVIPGEEFASVASAAIRVGFTKEAAIARTETMKYKDFVATVGAAAELTNEKTVRQRAMKIYASSGSFDQANGIAQSIIMPMTQAFDRQEIEEIVHVGIQNREIRFSHEFPKVLAALRVNKNVEASWWDPLLKAQEEDVFLDNLFFTPPPLEAEMAIPTDLQEAI
jgi:hypothetical protein